MRIRIAILAAVVCGALAGPLSPAAEPSAKPTPLVLLDETDTLAKWKGLEAVTEPAKTGKTAAAWPGAATGAAATLTDMPHDWSAWNAFRFDMHSGKANDATIILTLTSENENGKGDYYIAKFKIDWEGWKTVTLPFAHWNAARKPKGWNSIDSVNIQSRGWDEEPKADTVLTIDNVRLETVEIPAAQTEPVRREPAKQVNLPTWNGPLRYMGHPWEEVFKKAETDKTALNRLKELVSVADTVIAKPIVKRAYKMADVPENERDGRYKYAGKNAEIFILAMKDCGTANHLKDRLVPVAIAARYTGDQKYLDYCIGQLTETATWVPFQRPGWTAYSPDRTLPPGGDGNWLATGNAINGVVETLDILGERIPRNLREKYRQVLQGEVDSIVDDWKTKRPWFVKSDDPGTNQWVLPQAGLVHACLYLADEKNREAYNMGVTNLARTAVTQGDDGSWREGLSYGTFSAEHVFWTAWACRRNGDDRLAGFPFVQNYHNWITHMLMPGRYCVNAFDCGMSTLGARPDESLMLDVMLTQAPQGFWSIQNLFDQIPATRLGLLFHFYAGNAPKSDAVPPTFAFFPAEQVLTWRDTWNNRTAMGVWVRGGSPRDFHSHRDNGHVSLYNGLTAILIECGTCSYADPDLNPKYAQAAGHNILQIDEAMPRGSGRPTPITVETLDEKGARISVDGTRASNATKSWKRDLSWSAEGWLKIVDAVSLSSAQKPGAEFFRFHTGASLPLEIAGEGKSWTAKWAAATMTIETDRPVKIDQIEWPDKSGIGKHQCIRIQPTEATADLHVTTEIRFKRKVAEIQKLPSYADYLADAQKRAGKIQPVDALIRIEAENMTGSDPRFTIVTNKVNAKKCFLNWDYIGQAIEKEFDAPANGFYQVMTRHCTGAVHGTPVRSLHIDGAMPFREAAEIVFPFTGGFSNTSDDWQYRVLGEKIVEGGFRIYLPQGRHTVKMVCEDGGGLNMDHITIFGDALSRAQAIERTQAIQ